MKKNLLNILGTLLLCVLPSLTMSAQTQYCKTAINSTNSQKSVYLTCQTISDGQYEFKIESDEIITGFNSETMWMNINNPQETYNFSKDLVLAVDGLSLSLTFNSTALPKIYAGIMFLNIPGEFQFNLPTDIDWTANCSNPGPVATNLNLASLSYGSGTYVDGFLASKTTYSVSLPGGTTDAPVVTGVAVEDNSKVRVDIVQAAALPGTATVTVVDLADDTRTKVYTINFSVLDTSKNTECAGNSNEVEQGEVLGYSYQFESTEEGVVVTAELLDVKDGIVAYVFDYTEGAPQYETRMTVVEGQKLAATLPYTTEGQIITVGIKFEYAGGGMMITKRFEYTVGKVCENGTSIVLADNATLQVYPNPVVNSLNVESESNVLKVLIYNASGQLVKDVEPNTTNANISVSDLATGQYLVVIRTADGIETVRKIIK